MCVKSSDRCTNLRPHNTTEQGSHTNSLTLRLGSHYPNRQIVNCSACVRACVCVCGADRILRVSSMAYISVADDLKQNGYLPG
jgi:hypothetical protein